MPNQIKLALLRGGISGEREVSLNTGKQIFAALDKDKYLIAEYDPKTDLEKLFTDIQSQKIDLVFPALHGPFGEDGRLQGFLDMLQIPYVFSNCLTSALAMNKPLTKVIARENGLTICDYVNTTKNNFDSEVIITKLGLPLVVKPVELGSSVGMSIAKTKDELEKGVQAALEYDNQLMIEKFVKGRELTCAVMQSKEETKALPVIEIKPKTSSWFDYQAKYEAGASEEICPAKIPDEIRDKVQSAALKIFQALSCKDLARADFIWVDDEIFFLEINTIPGMTATSLAPQAAKAAGHEFSDFLDILINNNL